MSGAIQQAYEEVRRLYAIEASLIDYDDRCEEGERAFNRAVDATSGAIQSMMALPATDIADAMMKVEAVLLLYDAGTVPMLVPAIRELQERIVAQARQTVAAIPPRPEPTQPEPTQYDPQPGEPGHSGWLSRLRASRWAWLEPWYDWGAASLTHHGTERSGDGWHAGFDWLGIHLQVFFGRSPKAVRHG